VIDKDYQDYQYLGSVGPNGEKTSLSLLKMAVKLGHPVTCVDIDAGSYEAPWRVFVSGTALEAADRLHIHLTRFPEGAIGRKVLTPVDEPETEFFVWRRGRRLAPAKDWILYYEDVTDPDDLRKEVQ
jgi:hypothetical protein